MAKPSKKKLPPTSAAGAAAPAGGAAGKRAMIVRVKAIPSCDQAFLVWEVSAMIAGCLGFAVFREVKGQAPIAIHTWVGFEDEAHKSGDHKPSTDWPIQKTSWTDYLAPLSGTVRYGVVPVLGRNGAVAPVDPKHCVWSDWITLDQGNSPVSAWFNRGTISAQWLARALKGKARPRRSQPRSTPLATRSATFSPAARANGWWAISTRCSTTRRGRSMPPFSS